MLPKEINYKLAMLYRSYRDIKSYYDNVRFKEIDEAIRYDKDLTHYLIIILKLYIIYNLNEIDKNLVDLLLELIQSKDDTNHIIAYELVYKHYADKLWS